MSRSDKKIAVDIRHGRKDAFQSVFDSYYEGLCQYAFTILKDMVEAEDVVQSVFIKIWERRDKFDIKQTIKSYLFKSVHNRCMNLLEHKTIRQKYFDLNQNAVRNEIQHPDVFPDELEETIKDAINELSPQCRRVFMMSRYEELRYSEIALKLDISVNTVENQISKALRILRLKLKDVIV